MFPRGVLSVYAVTLGRRAGWSPRSPDSSPRDFFLWRYLESQHRPQTVDAPSEVTTQEAAAAIPPGITRIVVDNYRNTINRRIEKRGPAATKAIEFLNVVTKHNT